MPYTPKQCRAFRAMAHTGGKPPKDWRQYCVRRKPKKRKTR